MTEALAQYKVLAEMNANPYQEEAATRVAEICYDKADYACALEAFYRMHTLASSRENTNIARLGILRCSQALGRHQAAIDIADQILADLPVDDDDLDGLGLPEGLVDFDDDLDDDPDDSDE